jgi:hypothetical protein
MRILIAEDAILKRFILVTKGEELWQRLFLTNQGDVSANHSNDYQILLPRQRLPLRGFNLRCGRYIGAPSFLDHGRRPRSPKQNLSVILALD